MLQTSATVAYRSIAACMQGSAIGAHVPETHDRPVNGGEEAASPDTAQPWIPIRPFVVGHVPRKMEWCVDDEKWVPVATLTSDASGGWGGGAFTSSGEWFQLQWPECWSSVHITVKQLAPI